MLESQPSSLRLAVILLLIFSLLDRAEECLRPQQGAGRAVSQQQQELSCDWGEAAALPCIGKEVPRAQQIFPSQGEE